MSINPKKIFTTSRQVTTSAFDTADSLINQTIKTADSYIEPVRQSVLERFPVLFLLLVTFGITTTSFAFEKILSQYDILNRFPWLILLLGVGTLALTGKLYKKLL